MATREQNQKTFGQWIDNADGTRTYWYDVPGKHRWRARYIKIVDKNEKTISFYQEIFNERAELVEIHEKYPTDTGHKTLRNN